MFNQCPPLTYLAFACHCHYVINSSVQLPISCRTVLVNILKLIWLNETFFVNKNLMEALDFAYSLTWIRCFLLNKPGEYFIIQTNYWLELLKQDISQTILSFWPQRVLMHCWYGVIYSWGKDLLQKGHIWCIGSGINVLIYSSPWLPHPGCFKILSQPVIGGQEYVEYWRSEYA